MSPEQLRGDLALDLRADVYALGMSLYELLEGRPGIDLSGLSLQSAVARLLADRPPLLRDVPADVAALWSGRSRRTRR